MSAGEINSVAVIGAGNMGHQISLCCALAGLETSCTDVSEEQLQEAEAFMEKYLSGRVAKGKLLPESADQAAKRLRFTTSLEEAVREADFVIEAITEKLDLKKDLFRKLDQLCPPQTILATNSSFFVSSLLAGETNRPELVCNMHFFNPALVMKCVEVVKGPHTAAETAEAAMELARRMGKEPVLLHKEIYGFLVNRILRQIIDEALFLLDTGVASMEDIDSAVVNALGHPMGPFTLMDLTGIDLSYHSAMERYRETGDPGDKPSPTVVEKYVKGEWGRKKGRGFYNYEK
ncbi:MAG: 3-hydroxyacyl-CoA dehydrogenase family protein [Dethiobacteria bacterium]|jgi:3-hydroxybutyryl-CoA dehydrogenase|nr:3-hydroxyacyl-CoA dehydrogenase family protein [Bacillota bacterium]HOB28195.1 3-hydroxyacyl-CoA dehydrogenase family protein [Bacillota bacterium]HPZ40802.1 3-hydroxyacyl-CoA dehydrogenase family protein [Bacillota bacterium]HQD51761.1 3-hydroxyacyl-CoA dehydrogenase family protein [Bacillota bacterium]